MKGFIEVFSLSYGDMTLNINNIACIHGSGEKGCITLVCPLKDGSVEISTKESYSTLRNLIKSALEK